MNILIRRVLILKIYIKENVIVFIVRVIFFCFIKLIGKIGIFVSICGDYYYIWNIYIMYLCIF